MPEKARRQENGPTKFHPNWTCGFRFSVTDAFVLIAVSGFSFFLWPHIPDLAIIALFTLLHFFLFCNIFRIRRKPELIWAGIFLLMAGVGMGIFNASVWIVAGLQLPVTIYLIFRETRHESYHGLACRLLNPQCSKGCKLNLK